MVQILFNYERLMLRGLVALDLAPDCPKLFATKSDHIVGVLLALMRTGVTCGFHLPMIAADHSGASIKKARRLLEELAGNDPERHFWSEDASGDYNLLPHIEAYSNARRIP